MDTDGSAVDWWLQTGRVGAPLSIRLPDCLALGGACLAWEALPLASVAVAFDLGAACLDSAALVLVGTLDGAALVLVGTL
jgi:hypothetical protein